MRICINEECAWIGNESDCLDWKHPTGERFCPKCHEVTEEIRYKEKKMTNNVGKPTISILIQILKEIREKHGDLLVVGAYDGDWNTDVSVMVVDDRVVIGSIS